MSASELLEQVRKQLKKLPAAEKDRFFTEIVALEGALTPNHKDRKVPVLNWPDIHARHHRIFGDTVLQENVVLAARDEED
jgi:hypothetical protein